MQAEPNSPAIIFGLFNLAAGYGLMELGRIELMSQSANQSIAVAASPQMCFDVVTEVGRYPEWIAEIKEVKVLARGDDGLPGRVFSGSALWVAASTTLWTTTTAPILCVWLGV